MDTDLILLKAQFDALRNVFAATLPSLFSRDKAPTDKAWYAKFCLWRFERENLAPYSSLSRPASPETEQIDRRRFQLQVLMDVAYIQGHLEEYGIAHRIAHHAADCARTVFGQSDGTEASMIALIDKL